ncbi:MAG TPA: hypothetical protein VIG25_21155 [Pyrinomonadaceae bacterium]|jgi:hypothetical protein
MPVNALLTKKSDLIVSTIIFVVTLVLFLFSRVHQLTDSNYSMLVSQSLLQHHSFTLDSYDIPRLEPTNQLYHVSVGKIYQLEYIDNHIYYFWPNGTSLLSIPFVALMNALGVSAANADGTYNPTGEITIQARLAALLMAILSVVFYFTSRFVLPLSWSAGLALSTALGTQIWSTASRALWSETWGIFLLGFVVLMLVANELGKWSLRPGILATLLAWTYFVRPTFSVAIVAITIYLILFYRPCLFAYAATGAAWLAAFVAYSWFHYRQLLPNYYLVYRHFGTTTFWTALSGNLISPSRGLLVFVPILFFVFYLVFRYWSALELPRLAVLSIGIVVTHLIVVSAHSPWYGGHCYGPRYSTGVVPWFFLLGTSALTAWRKQGFSRRTLSHRLEILLGAMLLLISVTIQTLGATEHATWLWNSRPVNVDEQPDRVWDWKHPQFLAKWVH